MKYIYSSPYCQFIEFLNFNTVITYKKFPQGFILGSETASTVSSRGNYYMLPFR